MLLVVVLLFHVMVAAGICLLVLLQHGKGADVGAAFGSGASGSLFGASGSANFLSRSTAVLAGLFFLTSLTLTWFHGKQPQADQRDGDDQGRAAGGTGHRRCGSAAAAGCSRDAKATFQSAMAHSQVAFALGELGS